VALVEYRLWNGRLVSGLLTTNTTSSSSNLPSLPFRFSPIFTDTEGVLA